MDVLVYRTTQVGLTQGMGVVPVAGWALPVYLFVASPALMVTSVWQAWARAALSQLLVTVEACRKVGQARVFCS